VRTIDNGAMATAAGERFRSEYHYAVFEYLRSAKVVQALERAGAALRGRVLDAGCGSGGTALSLAEESGFAVGLDLDARFRGSGTLLAREKGIANAAFVQGDGARLPFRDDAFDLVFSHSVIEHVACAEDYLKECHRVLRRGLPRLPVPGPTRPLAAAGAEGSEHLRRPGRAGPGEGGRPATAGDGRSLDGLDPRFRLSPASGRPLRHGLLPPLRPPAGASLPGSHAGNARPDDRPHPVRAGEALVSGCRRCSRCWSPPTSASRSSARTACRS
jgi:SAM-dependent methyltransferase